MYWIVRSDNFLGEFGSVSEAVNFAVEIQNFINHINADETIIHFLCGNCRLKGAVPWIGD